MRSKYHDIVYERAAKLFGLEHHQVGKSEARQQFLPLMKELTSKPLAVEVTDRDKGIVVMMSKVQFETLINKLWQALSYDALDSATSSRDLMGSITIVGDLEEGSKKAAAKVRRAAKMSADAL